MLSSKIQRAYRLVRVAKPSVKISVEDTVIARSARDGRLNFNLSNSHGIHLHLSYMSLHYVLLRHGEQRNTAQSIN
jgi:hypothetical protein